MKTVSFLVAAVLLSSNAFSQAKPSDLSPTPMTHTADAATPAPAPVAKGKKAHKAVSKVKKATHRHAANAKKHMKVAKAKLNKNDRKNAVR